MIEAGIYPDIANNDYHHGPGDSKSDLDRVRRSPLHYKTNKDAANDNERKDSPTSDQAFGSAYHTFILEPEEFINRYVTIPEDAPKRPSITQRNAAKPSASTLEAIDFWDKFEAESAGKEIIDLDDLATLNAMAEALKNDPAASALLGGSPGRAEMSAYWVDPRTGLLLRCRPDYWREDGILVDLKTTIDASLAEFSRSVVKWRYHVQAPFYLDGTNEAITQSGAQIERPTQFVFVAQEKKPPFAVACYVLDDEGLRIGRAEYRADLDRLAECKASDVWPGYGSKIQQISVPVWYSKNAVEANQ